MSIISDRDREKNLDLMEKSVTDYLLRQRTIDEKIERSSSPSEKKLPESQVDANISNFFNAHRVPEIANKSSALKAQLNRNSPSPSKKKPRPDARSLFSKKDTSEREKEHLFLEYYDDNLKLRQNQTKLEQHIKELKTKLRVIEGEYVYSKKKFEGDTLTKEDLNFIDELKKENQTLKQQLHSFNLPRPQVPGSSKKVLVKSTTRGVSAKSNSDHIRLIDLLKMQLKKAETEIQSLHQQLAVGHHRGGSGGGPVGHDMHDKNVKLATLQHRFENLDGAFSSQKQMLEKNKQMMEDVNRMLYQERTKNSQLEVQLRSAEMAAATARDLQLQLDEAEREKKMLEAKYKDLVESPFFRDVHEKAANPARLREAENQLGELKAQLKGLVDQNTALEKQVVELSAQLKTVALEREKFKEEKTKAEAILQEKEKTQGFLDKQMEIFNISNDREKDNFLKALGKVRLQGEEPAWKRLEFIERHNELDINNIPSLLKEIDRLRLEKSEIAAQLEKAQTLLHTHLEMEKEKDIIHHAETDKLSLQLKSSNNRIEELTKLADFRARNYRDNMMKSGLDFKPYEEGASEFSEMTESELASTENTLDALIRNVELDELVLRKLLAGKVLELDGLQTMVAVDFYNHETQNSEICEGMKPNYNFQVAYKVNVDENLIHYMENEFLRVEIYGVIHSDLKLLGTAYVPYRELLIKNYDIQYGSSPVVLLNSIIYGERKSDIIGVAKVKLRMRHPMSEALRWVKERAEFMKETQANLDIRMDPTLKSRKLIIQVDKVVGLDKRAASFVYYKLYNLRDVCTPTVPGNEPVFNYISTHDLAQNESVRSYLEKEYLEFVVFDDTQPITRGEQRRQPNSLGDVIGRGKVKLSSLLENYPIDQHVVIYNIRGTKVATLYVRIYWFDTSDGSAAGNLQDTNNLTKIWEDNMTRNIVAAMRMKGQNLDSAFSIFDNDSDGKISYPEFRDGVLRTFHVRVKEEEVAMYWKRFPLRQDYLYKDDFFIRFGPYMSYDENMRVTYNKFGQAQDGQYRMSEINNMLDRNSQDMNSRFGGAGSQNSQILQVLARKLAQHIQASNLPIDALLSKFDRDNSGFISRAEMRTCLNSLGIPLSEQEIENLLLYFDVNNDNKVSVDEFKTITRGSVLEELQRLKRGSGYADSRGDSSRSLGHKITVSLDNTTEDTRTEVVKFLCDYIKQNKMTLLKFTKDLDEDRSGYIKKDELETFFRKNGIKIERREMEALLELVDPQKTNNIPIRKFTEIMAPYMKEKPKMTNAIERSLMLVAEYMNNHKLDVYAYFKKFDVNKNGFIERKELKVELEKLGVITSDIELNNLLSYFDDNEDGRISSKEFIGSLEPFIRSVKKMGTQKSSMKLIETPNTKAFDDLKGKCHNIIRQNSGMLNNGFAIFKENKSGQGHVSKENFAKVLYQYNLGFMPAEIDLIIDYLTEKNAEGLVNYERFLKDFGTASVTGVNTPYMDSHSVLLESKILSESHDRPLKRLSSAEDIFSRISKILKNNKISSQEAFKIFDKDRSGKIGRQELRDAFAGMQLGLDKEELEDVIRHIDKTGDGQIDYNEFIRALKL